jgi:diadenosine tetraphosphate (Ap4A) HIT family hydrolase
MGRESAHRISSTASGAMMRVAGAVRRLRADETDVFCGKNSERTRTLFETENFYVIPSLKPLSRGHLLIISKQHFPAFRSVPARYEKEYTQLVRLCREFVADTYGRESLIWENGGPASGQSVHHAHLQIIPIPNGAPDLPAPTDSRPVGSFEPVRQIPRQFTRRVSLKSTVKSLGRFEPYHYVEFRGYRRLLGGESRDLWPLLKWQTEVLNIPMRKDGMGWDRKPNLPEVHRCEHDFQQWLAMRREAPGLAA